ncbi:terminal uridylyltransferase 7-like [Rhipicephalus microplus]|uniref:terminal uridylyltransferase 7-like n=1 Tax=Rhipicephalus microplus TaxID=6941 RepID=UPI003F6AA18C
MVYYLQQCNLPVIPVLQELYPDGEQKPQNIVEGWDAWFFEEIDRLPSVWPEFGRNNQSPGDLWLGLLRFYTKEFNFREHVVCIRQKAPLTRLEKWTSKSIAIEDPFRLDRDVGKSATKMTQILECLVQGYEHFKRPVAVLPRRFSTFVAYFFDERKIVVGKQSNGGGCRVCGKIRHIMKDCPDRGDRTKGCQYQPRMHHRSDVQHQHHHRHHYHHPNDVLQRRHTNESNSSHHNIFLIYTRGDSGASLYGSCNTRRFSEHGNDG